MRLAGARVEATRVRHTLSKHGTATQRRPGHGQQEPDRGAACVSSVPEASQDSASRRAGAVRSGLGAARAMLVGAAWATRARAQMDTHRQADGGVAVTMDAAGAPRGPCGSPPPGLLRHTGTPQPPPSRPHTPVLAELRPSGRSPALRGPVHGSQMHTCSRPSGPGCAHTWLRVQDSQRAGPPAAWTAHPEPPPAPGLQGHVEVVRRQRGAWPAHARARPLCQAYSLDPASTPSRETHTPSTVGLQAPPSGASPLPS